MYVYECVKTAGNRSFYDVHQPVGWMTNFKCWRNNKVRADSIQREDKLHSKILSHIHNKLGLFITS